MNCTCYKDILSQIQTHATTLCESRRLELCRHISPVTVSSLLNAACEEGGTRGEPRKKRHTPFCLSAVPVRTSMTVQPGSWLPLSPRWPRILMLPWIYQNQLAVMPTLPPQERGSPAGLASKAGNGPVLHTPSSTPSRVFFSIFVCQSFWLNSVC